ncbi:3-phosphoshikimate 1-carboxyvinyltransferase [Streptomyces gardneri]|uniref:3-phosphoshikimate 1-carboxyvinyltransferase n=1 Tax=Streptomyces gardneri TaxID=66892 RepID=UPI0006BD6C91|nr:3-phosphoshikimate 1-carboxyvinyltransferase [Streptomyces gardneri]QPK48275.1 3-phosphoshikimate 1-carboxyvinyltransferase [Streptomyces gardneri]WRK39736.1 3-phosphoshikimate 1-carboxyvinyltransferase [Streptomyces venezuelae]CUM38116.1 5-Enolpyruvylshikimate-3-phosphate synthase [Streptomyces venezuelae]
MTVIDIPGSKSVTARALFLAAAAEGTTTLLRPLVSDDTEGFAEGLTALGYALRREPGAWHVEGRPDGPGADTADVYCRDGATTARFLPTLVAAGRGTYRFDASAQMRGRPLGPLSTALRTLGVDLRHLEKEGHHPLDVHASGVKGGALTLDAGQSSQYLTALLMLGPLTAEGLDITVTDLVSEPYVEITLAMMRAFGADVRQEGRTYRVAPTGYRARTYGIEPDASTASYFFAAAALEPGRSVTVPGLGTGALQGDLAFVDVLRRMGAEVEITDTGTTVRSTGTLRGLTVNMRDISDTMPTLAALAPFADGPVRIEDVANTRVKECDRLDACAENLRRLGITVRTGPDWIEIHPGTPTGPVEIATHGDHRIVMSFAVTALRTPGITFDDPGCVKKTFPDFHRVFDTFVHTP